MGANLIGYMVVGPVDLDTGQTETATERAAEIIALAKDFATHEANGTMTDERYQAMVRRVTELDGDPEENLDYRAENVQAWDPGEVVRELFDCWDGGFRDEASRVLCDQNGAPTQRIVFAGAMTWGDEPEGAGYQALHRASTLGLFPLFGIS